MTCFHGEEIVRRVWQNQSRFQSAWRTVNVIVACLQDWIRCSGVWNVIPTALVFFLPSCCLFLRCTLILHYIHGDGKMVREMAKAHVGRDSYFSHKIRNITRLHGKVLMEAPEAGESLQMTEVQWLLSKWKSGHSSETNLIVPFRPWLLDHLGLVQCNVWHYNPFC